MGIDDVFAVIAERTRRDILELLRAEGKSVGQLVGELGVSQPTVSKHLKVLREAGLVTMRAQGQKRFYSLESSPLLTVQDWIAGFTAGPAEAAPEAPVPSAVPGTAPTEPAAPVPAEEVQAGAEVPATGVLAAAALAPAGSPRAAAEATRQQQIGRTMGRAAERAADLISQLRRRKDHER
ncbi:ArsR family transcriptional regulator [Arthrobacter crusticola]|uniref:ArsR family transcriptional regulator n=1 Tax=Arthrobacter crusticola TaxID=2547960 RepID=A0A4R5TWF3_9MICC|nr:metalloregulator ArsR/SmtB family transcription factor [Arthrobacter crusticola]TDK25477.1 ArsR family transcriptional regulator [Arthrobacter crusticola]